MVARRTQRYTRFSVEDLEGDDREEQQRFTVVGQFIRVFSTERFRSSWKLIVSIVLLLIVVVACILIEFSNSSVNQAVTAPPRPSLSFRSVGESNASSSYKFTILQIADIHLGEAEDTDWGPRQDEKTFHALRSILSQQHVTPDLIIFSGDQVTANNIVNNATAYYKMLGDFIETYHIPWGIIFGNHDDAEYVGNSLSDAAATTLRSDLLRFLQLQPYNYHMTRQDSSTNVFGVSNYVLNVTLNGNIALQVILLDSGGGSLPNQLLESQLDWISTERIKGIPAVFFQHIPTHEYVFHNNNNFPCVGSNGDGGVDPLNYDPGIVNFLSKDGYAYLLAVGHNHGNSYCCPAEGGNNQTPSLLSLCFGRHSGYGGYGNWDRGARVYELTLSSSANDEQRRDFSYKSWLQMESGNITEEYIPPFPKQ